MKKIPQDKICLIRSLYTELKSCEKVARLVELSPTKVNRVIWGERPSKSKLTIEQKTKIKDAFYSLKERGENITLQRIQNEGNLNEIPKGTLWSTMKAMNLGYPIRNRKASETVATHRPIKQKPRPKLNISFNKKQATSKTQRPKVHDNPNKTDEHSTMIDEQFSEANAIELSFTEPCPYIGSQISDSSTGEETVFNSTASTIQVDVSTESQELKPKSTIDKDILNMSVDDVIENIMDRDTILSRRSQLFRDNEIDGQSFMLLNEECMSKDLELKVGPILKIKRLQEEFLRRRNPNNN